MDFRSERYSLSVEPQPIRDALQAKHLTLCLIPQILVTSLIGTMFPVLAKRISFLRRNVPGAIFDFAKFFGSGVILTTAFIHLLEPAADEELNGDKCVSWSLARTCLC